ncbi:restriction endonuclease subunit S [Thiomicrospira cyclica]|uniref:Restriction modification system DNA specificity domain protein n=1 Tax=Thiomicrospira cyclica (strain DSM 14477 / JCM 11371 / ALM1) TaxID=717773 RepID=F6D9T7_THICA|nr:restriction endonuclease subunit S [Thiomicrospira cyclica]AEG32136.1 restriction modification system DNA specificity domain protein [Thiomicrospira cyclica ALM1]
MSWQVKKLGEVCTVIAGQSPEGKFYNDKGDGVPFYQGKKDFGNKFIGAPTTWTTKVTKLAEAGDVLMSVRAPVGPINFSTEKICIGRGLAAIRVGRTVNKEFLYYGLLSKQAVIQGSEGAVFASINKNQIENIDFLIPSLEEQKRIVEILDSAFEQIDQAKAIAQQNLQNAREIFDSALSRVSFPKRSWVSARLQDITLKIGSGATPRGGQSSYKTEGVSLVRSMNVHDRSFEPNKLAFIDDEQAAKLSNVIVEKDDVLLNITGASVARSCLMSSAYLPARVNQHVSIIRPFSTIIKPKLLNFFLTSKAYKDSLLKIGGSGATREAITKKQIQDFVIYFPKSTDEQDTLIKQVEEIENLSQNLESIYQQKIAALEEFKQSLLQQAFSGNLTANHSGAPV